MEIFKFKFAFARSVICDNITKNDCEILQFKLHSRLHTFEHKEVLMCITKKKLGGFTMKHTRTEGGWDSSVDEISIIFIVSSESE